MIDGVDIRRLNSVVRNFAMRADFGWDGMPVMEFRFSDMGRYMDARSTILLALSPDMAPTRPIDIERAVGRNSVEIDVGGVTLRLSVRENVEAPHI